MIVGLGTDVIALARIEESLARLGDRFARRILTPAEWQTYSECSNRNRQVALLGKRFCIKEAAAKALGTGIGRGVSWQHMSVEHNDAGAPQLQLTAGALERLQVLGGVRVHVSVSDEQDYAVATVILER